MRGGRGGGKEDVRRKVDDKGEREGGVREGEGAIPFQRQSSHKYG